LVKLVVLADQILVLSYTPETWRVTMALLRREASADLNSSIKSSISSKSSKSMTQFISSKQVHNASNLIYLKY